MNLDEQAEEVRGKGRREDGGASITYRDPRVSKFVDWIWGIVGIGVIAAITYVGSQLGGLRDAVADTNLQVALSRQQTTAILEELQDHEARIRQNERELSTIQGRNLRGVERVHR